MTDPLLAQSTIDRLTSTCHELIVEGDSYRRRQRPAARSGSSPAGGQPAHALIVKMRRDFHHISAASNYRPLSTLIAEGLSDNTSPSTVVRLELRP